MSELYKLDPKGNVTSPKSFIAGGTYAGLKTFAESKLDLGLLRCSNKLSKMENLNNVCIGKLKSTTKIVESYVENMSTCEKVASLLN